ncbi:MAG TPA: adenylate/guanylate cyclase domain-containing protein [Pirellulaceae bacterium]|nr:adenylate/guanylate cyclase domain-containing protein [Pirellulaceae bacterium]
MPDLIAQGQQAHHRWRRKLPLGHPVVIGRDTPPWSTPWDEKISRKHCELKFVDGKLHVAKVAAARNPIFFRGKQCETFALRPGENFVVGGTMFTLAEERVNVTQDLPRPATEQTFTSDYLKRMQFRHADRRIDALSRLPEIISGNNSDSELSARIVNVLLTGLDRAQAAALVIARGSGESAPVEVLNWDRRTIDLTDFSPSERLIRQAIASGESVVHVWNSQPEAAFTSVANVDWACATPVRGAASRGWAIYVAGRSQGGEASSNVSSPDDLRDELKFMELAAATLSSLREVRLLERQSAGLSQFFSPVVLDALAGRDPDEVLAPREADVSVLFCDLRGFSRRAEQHAGDLVGMLERVSQALGVMTRHILAHGGVIGDFHGDAAMGFWGWPLAQPDAAERACQAALAIRHEFRTTLSDFQVGIGIASGRAVAGKIGTTDQVKVTVFGPVVNLASRLEGLTKSIRAPILLDETTARLIRGVLSRDIARVRRVAVVRPAGLALPVEVSELLPPERDFPLFSDDHLATYEAALDMLLAKNWDKAFQLLHKVPAEDRVKDFLTVFIAQHNRTPPEGWDGVINIANK